MKSMLFVVAFVVVSVVSTSVLALPPKYGTASEMSPEERVELFKQALESEGETVQAIHVYTVDGAGRYLLKAFQLFQYLGNFHFDFSTMELVTFIDKNEREVACWGQILTDGSEVATGIMNCSDNRLSLYVKRSMKTGDLMIPYWKKLKK